jgi:DNA polymerase elongation subunit (family B)
MAEKVEEAPAPHRSLPSRAALAAAERKPLPRAEPPRLFGFDETPGVVAVEVSECEATLVRACPGASEDDRWEERVLETRPFRPWLLAGQEVQPESGGQALRSAQWTRLEGSGLVWLVEFPNWICFLEGREQLRAEGSPHHAYGHPVKQFLIRSGITLFKEMDFGGVRRLQFDLETTTLRPADEGSRILLLVAGDNRGGEWVFSGDDERRILLDFLEVVKKTDPDVIEGHNVFGFDLQYLHARAQALRVSLALGRNGSTLVFGRERNCPIGGISRPFKPAHAWGRHFLDTLLAVQRFDVGRGELASHGLKEVAVHYGIAAAERVYLDRAELAQTWKEDPERVRRYALQDVEETRRLAELVLPTEFYQSQMVPESFQNVATGGSGEKINSLLIREYLRQGHGIPQTQPPMACPGGYTEIRRTGILKRVVKADAESLYPSIMLRDGICPSGDTLGVFLPMLRELTTRRLDAKAKARAGGPEGAYWDGLQSSFKILINSFYGYLGAAFNFNDYRAATEVTRRGQELVKAVAEELERTGSQVIEIDTDGVYFVPPPEVLTEAAEREYVERVGKVMPEGIRLAYDGRYAAMVSLKIKNYVLVDYEGKKTVKGASLRSRADEAFGREFLARAMDRLIAGDVDGLAADYADLSARISEGRLPIEAFARRERVTEKTFRSEAKKRSREVARDLQVGDSIVVYQRADGSLGLASEYARDEDRWYYLEKLHRFAERLQEAMGEEFTRIIPRPNKKRLVAEQAGQLAMF